MSFRLSEGKKKSSFGKLATVTTAIASIDHGTPTTRSPEKTQSAGRESGRNPSEGQHIEPNVRVINEPKPRKEIRDPRQKEIHDQRQRARQKEVNKGRRKKESLNNHFLHSNHY